MYEARYWGILSAILHMQAGFIHVICLGISNKSVAVYTQTGQHSLQGSCCPVWALQHVGDPWTTILQLDGEMFYTKIISQVCLQYWGKILLVYLGYQHLFRTSVIFVITSRSNSSKNQANSLSVGVGLFLPLYRLNKPSSPGVPCVQNYVYTLRTCPVFIVWQRFP